MSDWTLGLRGRLAMARRDGNGGRPVAGPSDGGKLVTGGTGEVRGCFRSGLGSVLRLSLKKLR